MIKTKTTRKEGEGGKEEKDWKNRSSISCACFSVVE